MNDLFSQPPMETHQREDNPTSEAILTRNRERFSNQMKALFLALYNGDTLSDAECLIRLGIGDGRRRVKDLLDFGVRVTKTLKDGRYKIYTMSEDDKEFNKKFL